MEPELNIDVKVQLRVLYLAGYRSLSMVHIADKDMIFYRDAGEVPGVMQVSGEYSPEFVVKLSDTINKTLNTPDLKRAYVDALSMECTVHYPFADMIFGMIQAPVKLRARALCAVKPISSKHPGIWRLSVELRGSDMYCSCCGDRIACSVCHSAVWHKAVHRHLVVCNERRTVKL